MSTAAAFMARAIRLGERGLLSCAPNPRVGCVLVRDGQIVGEGWHAWAGQAHAEVNALAAAGDQSRGATAYVSLEPCNHQGRTGPCAEALIEAGVAEVVFAAPDLGAGSCGGSQRLLEAGLRVSGGLLQSEAESLNPGFHRRQSGGLPWVRLKLAQSLDGRAALESGESQWITGEAARRDGHRWRARSCALVTGIGTVLADDPQMTARLPEATHQPLRVVMDSQGRTPAAAKLRQDDNFLILHAQGQMLGPAAIAIDSDEQGLSPRAAVAELARRGCNEILIEAGPRLNAAFLRAGIVDEVILYTAPNMLGDGRPAAALGALSSLDHRLRFEIKDSRRFGEDWRIIARPLA